MPFLRKDNAGLRIAVLAAAGALTAGWLITFDPVIRHWNNLAADGLQWVPAFFATPIWLVLVAPAIGLGIFGGRRALGVAGLLLLAAAATAVFIFQ